MALTSETLHEIPAHVPADRVWEGDLETYLMELDDPYLAGSRLHDEAPEIFWAQNVIMGKPAWVLTRHAHMQEAYQKPEIFSSDRQNLALLGVDWKLNPLEYDPPEHSKYRRILNPFFTPKAMAQMDDVVHQVCHTLIDKFADKGHCEFVTEFAEEFPSYIFLDLMGMPKEKLRDFLEWEREMIHAKDPMDRFKAMKAVLDYFEGYVKEQQENPTTDIMRGIFSALVDGRPLNHGEVLGMCYLLYIGGLDTVFSTLGWVMRHLAEHPELQARLRAEPEAIPAAVEEFLRAYPVATTHREVKEDVEFHGVTMKKGDWVKIASYLAGRDSQVYPDPHTVDIDRGARHISFATGPHMCLGMHLAKRELKAVIEAFLSRFDNIRIPEGERYTYHTGGVFGVDKLPLTWDV